jgi:hypothetical protein
MQPKVKQKIKLVAGLGLSSLVFGGGLFRVLWVHVALPGWTTFGAVLRALGGNYEEMGVVAGPVVALSMYDALVKRNEYGDLGRRLLFLFRKARQGGQSYRLFHWAKEKQKREYPEIARELPLELRNYLSELLLRSRSKQVGRKPKDFAEEARTRSVRVAISAMLTEEAQASSQEQMFLREVSQKSETGQLIVDVVHLKREKDRALVNRIEMQRKFEEADIKAYAARWDIYRLRKVSIPAAEDVLSRAELEASQWKRSGNRKAIRRAEYELDRARRALEDHKSDLRSKKELILGKEPEPFIQVADFRPDAQRLEQREENGLMAAQRLLDQAIYREARMEKNWKIGVRLALSKARPEELSKILEAAVTRQLQAAQPEAGISLDVAALQSYWEQATEDAHVLESELCQAEETLWLARRAYDEARLDPLCASLVEEQTALEEAKNREEQARKAWESSREARARLCDENSPLVETRKAAEVRRSAIKDAEFVRGERDGVQRNVPDVRVSHLHARVKFLRSRRQVIKRQSVYRRAERCRKLIQQVRAGRVSSRSIESGQTTSRFERVVGAGALGALALKEYWGVRLGPIYPTWPVLDLVNRVAEYPTFVAATFGYAVFSLAWISWLRPVREHLTFERSVTRVSSSAKGLAKTAKHLIVLLHHKELKKANPEEYQRLLEERGHAVFRFLMIRRSELKDRRTTRDVLTTLCATTRHPSLMRIRYYLTEAPRQTPEQRQAVIADWKRQRRTMLMSKRDQRTTVRSYEAELHGVLSDCMHARWQVRHERLLKASTAIKEASELIEESYGASSSTTGKEGVDTLARLKVVRATMESVKQVITSSDRESGIEVWHRYRLFLDKEAEYKTALRHRFFPLTGPPGEDIERAVIAGKDDVRAAARRARDHEYGDFFSLPGEDKRFENECRRSLVPHLDFLIEITEKLRGVEEWLSIATSDLSRARLISRDETERRALVTILDTHLQECTKSIDQLINETHRILSEELEVGRSWLRFRTAGFMRAADLRSDSRVLTVALGKAHRAMRTARLRLPRSRLPGAHSIGGIYARGEIDTLKHLLGAELRSSETTPRGRAIRAALAALGTPDIQVTSRGRRRSVR